MFRLVLRMMPAVLGMALLPNLASAQTAEGTVGGSGSVTLKPKATKLRVQLPIQAYGKSVELALERLKARRESVTSKLRDMKATQESISFGSPSVVKVAPPATPTYATPTMVPTPLFQGEAIPVLPAPAVPEVPEVESMPAAPGTIMPVPIAPIEVRKPVISDEIKPAATTVKELYSASATVTVEWPLETATVEGALVAAESLRKQVGELRAAIAKSGGKLPAEEQELLNQSGGSIPPALAPPSPYAAPEPGYAATGGPGTLPPLQFVAVITPQQRKAALAQAFAKAKTQASEVAEAAGRQLGPLQSLNGEADGTRLPGYGNYGPYGPEFGYPFGMPPGANENDQEAVSSDPGKLEFRVRVSAQFRLQ